MGRVHRRDIATGEGLQCMLCHLSFVRESYTSLPCCLLSRVWAEEAIDIASPRVDAAVSLPSPVRGPAAHAIFFLPSNQAVLGSPQCLSHVQDPR
jgi:hypothetical protein